ncbi:MAG: hypothetical protein WD894_11855 [Pirellulales bacterium]
MNHNADQCDEVQTSGDELHWLAFCYVAGELDADEYAAFELRLAGDQRAREAVAAAVELTHCVLQSKEAVGRAMPTTAGWAVIRPTAAPIGRAWLARAGWLLAGLAAGLLVMLTVQRWPVDRQPDVPAEQTASSIRGGASALAAQWSELREQASDMWEDSVATDSELDVAESIDGESVEDDVSDDSSEALLSADWLIAALAEHETADIEPAPAINQ